MSDTAWRHPVAPISAEERQGRIGRLRGSMEEHGVGGVLLGSTESLRYFTGLVWRPSERLLGALITPKSLTYIVPGFERTKVESMPIIPGAIATWEEHESPYLLVRDLLKPNHRLALDEQLPLFAYHGLAAAIGSDRLIDAGPLTRPLRARKSPAELALMAQAKTMTIEVHRRAHAALQPGMRASEVVAFVDSQHRDLGAAGSSFCIVSFGVATSLPHGADGDPALQRGDLILVDTGCRLDGYHSDITRTYMIDEPTAEIERIWRIQKEAQAAAFAAAQVGATCESVDRAARAVIEANGLGPDYRLPGLPHRTGHGIGLEIHEAPNLVRGDGTALAPGMCFSNEPMIVVPDQFGVRLEDHFYMTEDGARWFTEPQASLTEPFAGVAPFPPRA
ncbi:M24 family metallopeptidase [Microvirga terricola]|uniref:Aminopeptidase P family protein n=1 Tax=Microvirga terricola TaxID=2719797 RepID=A0ABX0VGJ2_9HYPH|nr:Xaa-Pro peptidase family protein [Microvirga terricola]NIX78394.1 aminopeptidase P family protein [Microvirga terricola]